MARATWPTKTMSGVESCLAMWMPAEALVAPGPRVTKQMPGRPVALPMRFGRHRRAALVAADGELDVAVVEGVERGEIAFPRHAKGVAHAVDDQLIHQDLAAAAHIPLPTKAPIRQTCGAGF